MSAYSSKYDPICENWKIVTNATRETHGSACDYVTRATTILFDRTSAGFSSREQFVDPHKTLILGELARQCYAYAIRVPSSHRSFVRDSNGRDYYPGDTSGLCPIDEHTCLSAMLRFYRYDKCGVVPEFEQVLDAAEAFSKKIEDMCCKCATTIDAMIDSFSECMQPKYDAIMNETGEFCGLKTVTAEMINDFVYKMLARLQDIESKFEALKTDIQNLAEQQALANLTVPDLIGSP